MEKKITFAEERKIIKQLKKDLSECDNEDAMHELNRKAILKIYETKEQ